MYLTLLGGTIFFKLKLLIKFLLFSFNILSKSKPMIYISQFFSRKQSLNDNRSDYIPNCYFIYLIKSVICNLNATIVISMFPRNKINIKKILFNLFLLALIITLVQISVNIYGNLFRKKIAFILFLLSYYLFNSSKTGKEYITYEI